MYDFNNIFSLFLAAQIFGIPNRGILIAYSSYHECSQLPNFCLSGRKKRSLLKRGGMLNLLVSRMFGHRNFHHTKRRSRLLLQILSKSIQHNVEKGITLSEILSPFYMNMMHQRLHPLFYNNVCLLKDMPELCKVGVLHPEFAYFLHYLKIALRIKTLLLQKNPFILFILDSDNQKESKYSKEKKQAWRKILFDSKNSEHLEEYKKFFQEYYDIQSDKLFPFMEIQSIVQFFEEFNKIGFQHFYTFCKNLKEGDSLEKLVFLFESSKNPSTNCFFTLRLPRLSIDEKDAYQLIIKQLNEIPFSDDWLQFLRRASFECLVEHDEFPLNRDNNVKSKTCRFLMFFYELVLLVQNQNHYFFGYLLFLIHIQTAHSENRHLDYANLLELQNVFRRAQKEVCFSESYLEFERILTSFNRHSTHKMNFDKFLFLLVTINKNGFLQFLVTSISKMSESMSEPNYYNLLKQMSDLILSDQEISNQISDGLYQFDNRSSCRICYPFRYFSY